MIEINLVPQKLKKAKRLQLAYFAGIGAAVILIAVMLGVYFIQVQKNAALDRDIKMVEAESASLTDKIAEVKKFNAMEDNYNKKKKIVDSLMYEQSFWARFLDSAGEMILPDMWYTKIEQMKDRDDGVVVNITGNALSKIIVADFIKRLEESKDVAEIKTARISDVTDVTSKSALITGFEVSYLFKKEKAQ
jgi:Tfp pilus assembly protein PilN